MIVLTWFLVFLTAQAPLMSTVAGTGRAGFSGDEGPAAQAQLNAPFDVAFDALGNLFLSDTFNHRIRRIDHQTGIITTVAGGGTKGFIGDGGPATEAQMNEPYGLAIDREGNIVFADRLNRRVRRVDGKTRAITTLAGNGSAKYSGDGGPAADAGLVEPNGVALDGRGRLYIADVADHRIRSVDLASGIIETFAGTGKGRHDGDGGPAASASIHGARAVGVGPDGTVYILERQGNSLRTVDARSRTIRTVAGTGAAGYAGDGGPALQAQFNGPKELTIDKDGNIYIVDTENHAIRRIDARTAMVATVAGTGRQGVQGDGGAAVRARLDRPHGVAIGADGAMLIGDTGNHRIRKVAP
jgi:sugar lactone lactonase YvrE